MSKMVSKQTWSPPSVGTLVLLIKPDRSTVDLISKGP